MRSFIENVIKGILSISIVTTYQIFVHMLFLRYGVDLINYLYSYNSKFLMISSLFFILITHLYISFRLLFNNWVKEGGGE